MNNLRAWVKWESSKADREKNCLKRICARFLDKSIRESGQAMRMLRQHARSEFEKMRALVKKKRGILNRLTDVNTRLIAAGYNKLCEDAKSRKAHLKNKLRFIIKALRDKDSKYIVQGYNGLKRRCDMIKGIGAGKKDMLRVNFCKKLTDKGYRIMGLALNKFKEFYLHEKLQDKLTNDLNHDLKAKKIRILKRIMFVNIKLQGIVIRQLRQHNKGIKNHQEILHSKKKGVIRRIVDTNARLVSMGYNKLFEAYKIRKAALKQKMAYIVKSLKDKDARYKIMGYNSMKQYRLIAADKKSGRNQQEAKKKQLIKRLMDKGFDMQVQGLNKLKSWKNFIKNKSSIEKGIKHRICLRLVDKSKRELYAGIRLLRIHNTK